MSYHVRHWTGESEAGFPAERFPELLDELAIADDEHPDVSVTHETEWALIAYKSGFAVLENLEGDGPVHAGPLERSVILELMTAVAEGRNADAQAFPWKAGYPV